MAIQGLQNILKIPDLRKRLGFTLGMIFLYQVGAHLTIPGVDPVALEEANRGSSGSLIGLIDMFTGGSFGRLTIFALGIMPYISASIILQLLTAVWPYLEELSKQGEEGRKKITQYTRYGTILITVVQSFMLSFYILNLSSAANPIVPYPGLNVFGMFYTFQLIVVLTVTTGTVILMFMGEQITARGLGNGISLIIFIGIVARFPDMVIYVADMYTRNQIYLFGIIALVVISITVTAGICIMTHAQRRITIKRGQRMMGGGRRMSRANVSYLPIRINTAGVIPVIFASSMLLFPATIASFWPQVDFLNWLSMQLSPGHITYIVASVVLIIFFTYFYTAITFNPKDVAENLQKYGATVPGYSHGRRTEEYIERILVRVTLAGAVFLAFVAVLPDIITSAMNLPYFTGEFLGGTSLIIVVGVALDTVNQIENHLRIRNYDGFRKRGRVKGRRL